MPTDLETLMAARNGPDPLASPAPLNPALPAVPVSDPFAAYKQPNLSFDITKEGKTVGTAPIAQILAEKDRWKGHAVRVTSPDDQTGTVPIEHLEDALAHGYKLETSVQSYARRDNETLHGLSGAVKAALQSYANELFLGVPDTIASHTESVYQKASREELRSEHPLATTLGTGLGFAGSLIAGGPLWKAVGLAGEGAGRLTERAVASALESRLAGLGVEAGAKEGAAKLATSMLANAAKVGTEAGLIVAPKAITEEAFGDHDAAAQSLLYGIGGGAALGALGTGAMDLFRRLPRPSFGAATVGEAAAVGASKVTEATDAAGAALDKTIDSYAAQRAASMGEDPALVRASLKRAYETEAGRVADFADVQEAGIRKVAEAGTPVLAAEAKLGDIAFMQKDAQMADLVKPNNALLQRDSAVEARGIVATWVNDLKASTFKGGIEGPLSRFEKYWKDWNRQFNNAIHPDTLKVTPSKSFILLDDLKRQIGKLAQYGRGALQVPDGALEADALYHELRGILENEDAWGKAALAQREVNQAYTAALSTRRPFDQAFVSEYGSEMGRPVHIFDPKKVGPFVRALGSADNSQVERALEDYSAGLRNRMKAIEAHYHVSDSEQAIVNQGRAALDNLEKVIGGVRQEAKEISTIEKMKKLEHGKGISGLTSLAISALNPLVGLAGFAADTIARPVATAERLGAASKWTDKIRSYANDKIGPLVIEQALRKTSQKLDEIPSVLERMAIEKPARTTLPAHAIARFLGGDSTDRRPKGGDEHFDKLSNTLAAFQANPVEASNRVGQLTSALAVSGAPKIAQVYGQAQLAALAHLHETMPRSNTPPVPFSNVPPWKPSRGEALAWGRRIETVDDPFVIYERLIDGTLSKEHVDTHRKVWGSINAAVVDRFAKEAAKPNAPKLPLAARQRLAMLTGAAPGSPSGTAGGARFQATYKDEATARSLSHGIHSSAAVSKPVMSDTQRLSI